MLTLPSVDEAKLAIQRSRWPGRLAISDGQSQAIGSGVPSPAGHRFDKRSPKTSATCAWVDPHPPQHRDGALFSDKKAADHSQASRIVDRDKHNTVLSKLALGHALIPELRTEIGFTLRRGRERVRRIR
jgi:hypothetical protein